MFLCPQRAIIFSIIKKSRERRLHKLYIKAIYLYISAVVACERMIFSVHRWPTPAPDHFNTLLFRPYKQFLHDDSAPRCHEADDDGRTRLVIGEKSNFFSSFLFRVWESLPNTTTQRAWRASRRPTTEKSWDIEKEKRAEEKSYGQQN